MRLSRALDHLRSLPDSAARVLLSEGFEHAARSPRGQAPGNLAPNVDIAAVGVADGEREPWPTDRDFARFPGVCGRNPFRDPSGV